jgi:hypothetical protein
MSEARATAFYWCAAAGAPMIAASQLQVEAGSGIVGDRYAFGLGAYSATEPDKPRHLTLITQDGIDTANAWQLAAGLEPFPAELTRRNVVMEGMTASELNRWVGRRFRLGALLCEGVELATPCERPSALSGIEGFPEAFDGRGGLRVRVLEGGTLHRGDRLLGEAA